jgi:N-acetylneuraminic acid mutarotase
MRSNPRTLTFDERVAAQRAIEEVYWRHRIWPTANPTPKPPLDAVMPDSAIRAKVGDYLRKSSALERLWLRPISGEQLQAEMNRMAKQSRDATVLRELFAALGNDPFVIAETLARQTLADRLIRSWYASDSRFHGALKRTADAALAACASIDCMRSIGGDYSETTWKLRDPNAAEHADASNDSAVALDSDDWRRRREELAVRFGGSPETLPTRRLSGLAETGTEFSVMAVIAQSDAEITVAVTTWPKRPFDSWWDVERDAIPTEIDVSAELVALPAPEPTECKNDTWTPTQLEAPDMRSQHTAVWTGTEMIVWGGTSGLGAPLNTGGRYNPSTDTWVPTSLGANVPVGRHGHIAVWTGAQMIIWGGFDGFSERNDGGRYDPSSDSWTPTSTGADAPTARIGHSGVWTGTEMIVWGGAFQTIPTGRLNTGGRYNPSTDSWRPTSTDAPAGRYGHVAVWTGAEMIIWGGSADVDLNTGGRYNPTTDTWKPTTNESPVPAPGARTAVWTGTEMIVWGGDFSQFPGTGGRYNPSTDKWKPTSTGANVPLSRFKHTAVWTGSEMIVWGGYPFYDVGGRYDPSTDSWSRLSTVGAPYARENHSAVWTGTEMIVWGGENCGGYCNPVSNTGGRYNPVTDSWVPTATEVNVPGARSHHSAVWTGAEMIVWGGVSGSSIQKPLKSGGRYNPSTDNWTPTSVGANVPIPRYSHSSIWTGKEMIVWGGLPGDPLPPFPLNDGARYDPLTDRWTPVATGPAVPDGRIYHTAVWTGAEMIVWGGVGADGYNDRFLNTGGRYDPSLDRWLPTSTDANVPIARYGHTAVWTGSEMIVWGGSPNDNSALTLNSGGRYSPSSDTWAATSTGPNVPAARAGFTSVWTGAEMIVWGGYDGHSKRNDGGRYAPSTDSWMPTGTGANVPAQRNGHTAVWSGAEMIVWGGIGEVCRCLLDSGGRYDPAADLWTATSTAANDPPARVNHTAVWTGTEMIVWGGGSFSTAGRYCACPNGTLVYRDADGDGYGDTGNAIPSCDGSVVAGYVAVGGDCDDGNPKVHPGLTDVPNGVDDNCNGLVDESPPGDTTDRDFNHDGEGDVCDVNDGLISVYGPVDKNTIAWQAESGPTSWNVCTGDLAVPKRTGVYTQSPGSNSLATRQCGLTGVSALNPVLPNPWDVEHSLVTGVTDAVEGSLGTDSAGAPRPNTNPCP